MTDAQECIATLGMGYSCPMNYRDIEIHHGRHLPHWRSTRATYAVTFRQADSLPASVLRQWQAERKAIVDRLSQEKSRPLTGAETREIARVFDEKIQDWLDRGEGSCVFREPRFADLMEGALKHFDRERYDLNAWVVMPNHVHVVVTPLGDHDLGEILRSWRGYTALMLNRALGRAGTFWQHEPYDHLVRDEDDMGHQIAYVLSNPARASLKDWRWVGPR